MLDTVRYSENMFFQWSNFAVAKPLTYRPESISNPFGVVLLLKYSRNKLEIQGTKIIIKLSILKLKSPFKGYRKNPFRKEQLCSCKA